MSSSLGAAVRCHAISYAYKQVSLNHSKKYNHLLHSQEWFNRENEVCKQKFRFKYPFLSSSIHIQVYLSLFFLQKVWKDACLRRPIKKTLIIQQ